MILLYVLALSTCYPPLRSCVLGILAFPVKIKTVKPKPVLVAHQVAGSTKCADGGKKRRSHMHHSFIQ